MANSPKSNGRTGGSIGYKRSLWGRVFEPLRGVVRVSVAVEHSLALVVVYGALGVAIVVATGGLR